MKANNYPINREQNRYPFIFPDKWYREKINSDDVVIYTLDNPSEDFETKSELNPPEWTNKKLQNLIYKNSFGSSHWVFDDKCNTICVWDNKDERYCDPLGFVAFHFYFCKDNNDCSDNTRSTLFFTVSLVWIKPGFRGIGVSKHLATHLMLYLESCSPDLLNPLGGDLDINYLAEYETEGGRKFSQYIEDHIDYLIQEGIWNGFYSSRLNKDF